MHVPLQIENSYPWSWVSYGYPEISIQDGNVTLLPNIQ